MNLKCLALLGSSAILVGFLGGYGLSPAAASNAGQPGYQYGGWNCGCYNNNCSTRPCCESCCQSLSVQQDVWDCEKFCAQAVFPCRSRNCDPGSVEPCDDEL